MALPLLAVAAMIVFGLSALASVFLALLVPVVALGLAAFAVATFHPVLAVRFGIYGDQALGDAFTYLGAFFRCVFFPLRSRWACLGCGAVKTVYDESRPAEMLSG